MTIKVISIEIKSKCKNKRCPQCPTEPSKKELKEKMSHDNFAVQFEKHINGMNDLTLKAKNHEISWQHYKKKWNKMKLRICHFTPFFKMKMVTCYPEEKCKTCGYKTTFEVQLTSDIALLPFQTKYRKTSLKNKKVCPKCGKLGIPHVDARGYLKFYHYKNGQRNVCYVGKSPE